MASSVNVYVMSSGIRLDHTEFGGRAISGRDAIYFGPDASDCYGLGTRVAGVIGGNTYGVAKKVRAYLGSRSGTLSEVH